LYYRLANSVSFITQSYMYMYVSLTGHNLGSEGDMTELEIGF